MPALKPFGLRYGSLNATRVVDVDAADVVDHVLEEREPGDEHVVGLDADQVADGRPSSCGPAEVERGVDLVGAVAGDGHPRVARDADRGGGAGPGVDADQLERVAAGAGHVLARAGRRSRRPGSRSRRRRRRRPRRVCSLTSSTSVRLHRRVRDDERPRPARAPAREQRPRGRTAGVGALVSVRLMPASPSRRRSRRSASPACRRVSSSRPADADVAAQVALGPEARAGTRAVTPTGAACRRRARRPRSGCASGVTPSIRVPMSALVIRSRSRARLGAGARGEARERVAEVRARVVAADVRRVEPALRRPSVTLRDEPLRLLAWAACRRPARRCVVGLDLERREPRRGRLAARAASALGRRRRRCTRSAASDEAQQQRRRPRRRRSAGAVSWCSDLPCRVGRALHHARKPPRRCAFALRVGLALTSDTPHRARTGRGEPSRAAVLRPLSPNPTSSADFGANEWLVEEMYEQYQRDPEQRRAGVGEVLPGQRLGGEQRYAGRPARRSRPPRARPQPSRPPRSRPRRQPEQAGRRPSQKAEPEKPRPSRSRAREASREPSRSPSSTGPTPVAKPRPASAAAEPAKGTTSPVAKDPKPAGAGRGQRRADATPCCAARPPAPCRTWTPR